jgi:hypothetical protein
MTPLPSTSSDLNIASIDSMSMSSACGSASSVFWLCDLPARDVVHKLLGREARRSAKVARPVAAGHRRVHQLAHLERVVHDGLVPALEFRRVLHRADQRLNHTERVHRRLLAGEMVLPHVGHGAVRGLVLLDQRAIVGLADQVRRDESG